MGSLPATVGEGWGWGQQFPVCAKSLQTYCGLHSPPPSAPGMVFLHMSMYCFQKLQRLLHFRQLTSWNQVLFWLPFTDEEMKAQKTWVTVQVCPVSSELVTFDPVYQPRDIQNQDKQACCSPRTHCASSQEKGSPRCQLVLNSGITTGGQRLYLPRPSSSWESCQANVSQGSVFCFIPAVELLVSQ